MGLTMREKQSITRETVQRYREADKKGKQAILDEFVRTTGYNRKYAIHLLANFGKRQVRMVEGQAVEFVMGAAKAPQKRKGKRIYGHEVKEALKKVWQTFDYMCGKRLVVLLRMNMDLLCEDQDFEMSEEVTEKLKRISASTIDRLLAGERKKLQLKGRSTTRAGTLLKHQIPIRVFYDWDERKPGFFELDRVAHDGGSSRGEYCLTLTATDVYSGWVELRALRNQAHRWVKEETESIYEHLPYPLKGVDSDNGGEFINHQLWRWANEHNITFTRSRAYHKNDNCFVEQKNDLAVRRTVGYYRFDTQQEFEALQEVYTHLCPLLNFYYPSVRLLEKTRVGAKVKKIYDDPKPPYLRMLESKDVDEDVKEELRASAKNIHIVKQKRLVDKAVGTLLRLYERKKQEQLPLLPEDS